MRRRRSVLSLFGVTRAGDPSCVLNFDGTTDALEGDVDKYPDECDDDDDDSDECDNDNGATHNADLMAMLDEARRRGLTIRTVSVGGGRFLAGAGVTINSLSDGLPLPGSAVPERYDRAAGYPGPLVAPPSFPEACYDRAGPTAPGSLLGIPGVSWRTVLNEGGIDPDSVAGRSGPFATTGTGRISFRGETGSMGKEATSLSGGRQVGTGTPTRTVSQAEARDWAFQDDEWTSSERARRLGLSTLGDDEDLLAVPTTIADVIENPYGRAQ